MLNTFLLAFCKKKKRTHLSLLFKLRLQLKCVGRVKAIASSVAQKEKSKVFATFRSIWYCAFFFSLPFHFYWYYPAVYKIEAHTCYAKQSCTRSCVRVCVCVQKMPRNGLNEKGPRNNHTHTHKKKGAHTHKKKNSLSRREHTYTHTHTYIYIYIYIHYVV